MLRRAWVVYARLFMEDKTRTEVFCKLMGELAWYLQTSLQDQMFLSVSRLTDHDTHQKDNKLENLSLMRLVEGATQSGDDTFTADVDKEITAIRKEAKDIRLHRHKRIAHFDLNVCSSNETLPTVTFSQLKGMIDRIEAFFNRFNKRYQNREVLFSIMTADDVTGGFETIVAKALMYDGLENEGVVAKYKWRDAII
jgi:hypothetical protein